MAPPGAANISDARRRVHAMMNLAGADHVTLRAVSSSCDPRSLYVEVADPQATGCAAAIL
jgi:hypothetical protein